MSTLSKTKVKILHSSCCSIFPPIREQVERVAAGKNIQVEVEELSEMKDTMLYGALRFPSLVIHGKVYSYDEYAEDEKLVALLK